MRVLADTSVWSLALRRSRSAPVSGAAEELARLIRSYQVVIIGPVRQELLSGIRFAQQYERLRERLRAFPDLQIRTEDYELARSLVDTTLPEVDLFAGVREKVAP